MDAQKLDRQVNDLVKSLTSHEQHKQNNAIREYFATDAILETPATTVKGIKDIKELADLHAAFYKDDRVDVSKVDWDDERKIASFSVKSKYALPLANAPWPWSLGRYFWVTIPSDVKLYVSPDDSYPVRSEATEATKYHVSKMTTKVTPRNTMIAAAYSTILMVVRIVAPYVINILITVNKFFQRHPLKEGLFRTGFAAAHDIVYYVLYVIRSHLPFIKAKGKKRTGDEPGLGFSATVQDTGRRLEASIDRARTAARDVHPVQDTVRFAQQSVKAVKDSKPVQDAVRYAQGAAKSVQDSQTLQDFKKAVREDSAAIKASKPVQDLGKDAKQAAKTIKEEKPVEKAASAVEQAVQDVKESEPVRKVVEVAEQTVQDVKESETVQQVAKTAEKVVKDVKESENVKEAAEKAAKDVKESELVKQATKAAQDTVSNVKKSEPVKEAAKAAETAVENVKQSEPVKKTVKIAENGAKAAEEQAQKVAKEAKKDVKDKSDKYGSLETSVKSAQKEHKKDDHKPKQLKHEHLNQAPQPIPLKKVDHAVAEAVKQHEAPPPVKAPVPQHDQSHPSFADIASHQPVHHSTSTQNNGTADKSEEAFPTLAEATGHEELSTPSPAPIETSPAHPSFADVAADAPEQDSTPSGSSTPSEDSSKPKPSHKKKKGKKSRK